mmetsp:Transcript_13877/g.31476  ORF Transcript_13877/g.31476 Transcript_13877/m.31476 type:complete len:462 (-) Transcript_13877:16-1401(-)
MAEVAPKSGPQVPWAARASQLRYARYVAVSMPLLSEQFLMAMPSSMITAVREEFEDLDQATITHVMAVGTAVNCLGKLAGGVLIDRFGARRFLSISMFAMAAGACMFGSSAHMAMPLVGYLILQICAAGGWLCACKLIEEQFEPERWSWCFAVVGIGSRAGSACSKLLLGGLLKVMTWRWIAVSSGAVMMLLRSLSLLFIPSQRRVEGKTCPEAERPWCIRVLGIVSNPSMLLYCCVAACCYIIAYVSEMDLPLLLQDTLGLEPADASMSASVFPAGLFTSLLVAAPLYSFLRRRCAKFALEISLEVLALASVLTVLKAVMSGWPQLVIYELLFFLMAFSAGLTYYVTPNMFPLSYGADCAFASACLDVVGLSFSVLFQMLSSFIFASGGTWQHILVMMAGSAAIQLVCTTVLSMCPRLTPHMATSQAAAVPSEPSDAEEMRDCVEAEILGKRQARPEELS